LTEEACKEEEVMEERPGETRVKNDKIEDWDVAQGYGRKKGKAREKRGKREGEERRGEERKEQ
jgi:hypothetical protein